jgi:uncharacterized membrane-anchored protein
MGRSAAIVLGCFLGAIALIVGANAVIDAVSGGTGQTTTTLLLSLASGATMLAIAGYVAASMARERPIAHAIAVGALKAGIIITLVFAAAARSAAAPPWYHVVDALIALPAAWLGGQFVRLRQTPSLQ